MTRTLREICSAVPDGTPLGRPSIWAKVWDEPISFLRCDSRLATVDTIFFCLVGKTSDGHLFANSAYHKGCRIFVVEHPVNLPADALQF